MQPARRILTTMMLTVLAMGLMACGDNGPTGPGSTGSLAVTTSTTGKSLDADGYMVSVAGGVARSIGINETVTVTSVPAGSQTVELSGVAGNCSVVGANPRAVVVTGGATVSTTIDVVCQL